MIRYLLKFWSNNVDLIEPALRLFQEKKVDGVELYNNVKEPLDWNALEALKLANVVCIHNPHSPGWHEFWLTDEERPHWEQTKQVADFFSTSYIIVHPARTHSLSTLLENTKKIADPRLILENMAGKDIEGQVMQCGQTITDLETIAQETPICFDLEKAVKAACHQHISYKDFIIEGLERLQPTYFQISGGVTTSPIDQHLNLWDCDMDVPWLRMTLEAYAAKKDIWLSFETPKKNGLVNDLANMDFFRKS